MHTLFWLVVIWALSDFLASYVFVLCNMQNEDTKNLGILSSEVLVIVMTALLRKGFKGKIHLLDLLGYQYVLLLIIPIGSIFIIYDVYILSAKQHNAKLLDESIVILIILLAFNYFSYYLLFLLSQEMETRKNNEAYKQQIELIDQYMKEKQKSMMDFRVARHDFKLHISVLIELVKKKENVKVEEYLENIYSLEPVHKVEISKTDNYIVDSIINSKYAEALGWNIKFTADIHVPTIMPFHSTDLSIAIGNVLLNAIEACQKVEEKDRYIKLYMKYENNVLIATIINSFDGTLIKNGNGKLETSKKDKEAHGIGLESVKRVAEKYHGAVVVTKKDKEFILKLTLLDCNEK